MSHPVRARDSSLCGGLLSVLLLCLFAAAAPAAPVTLQGPPAGLDLTPATTVFCDPSGTLAVDVVRTRTFGPLPGGEPTMGYRSGTCWFRFVLANAAADDLDLVLRVDFGVLDHLALHATGQADVLRSGDAEPLGLRPLRTRLNAFPLQLPAGATQEYLLAVSSMNTMYVPLALDGTRAFLERQITVDWVIGAFYGVGIGLAVYHLLLWLLLRERAYLMYVASVLATLFVFGGWHGLNLLLWPEHPAFNNLIQQNAVFLGVLFWALFVREYLDTRTWRAADRVVLAACAVIIGCILAQLVLPVAWLARMQGAMVLLSLSVCLAIGILRWRQGMRAARIYVASWLLFLSIATWLALATYGVLPWGEAGIEGMQVAIVLQQVLLSIGLAQRINDLKQEAIEHERAIARARAESAAKGEFLARMSHEIRTPLNAVIGISQLLRDGPPQNVQRDYVEALNSAGHSLLNLVNDILDHSKIASGKVELDDQCFDLHALIDQCVAIFSLSAQQKSLSLTVERADDVPRWVRGDATRLRQVLLNLLGNAIKFTDRGHVWLRVLRRGNHESVHLQFEVEDTGIGLDPKQAERLFQSFEQADKSTSRVYGGTGLGLSISQQLVDLMGGRISVRSAPGRGACFTFNVRLQHGEPPPELRNAPVQTAGLAHLRVLVAEDNAVNQLVINGLLGRLGISARIVANGEEAIAAAQEAMAPGAVPWDLLLLDCEMPRLDGFAAARRIREIEQCAGARRLPIIAMTAHALAESRERCLAAGMDDHLGKPLTLEHLADTLRRWT